MNVLNDLRDACFTNNLSRVLKCLDTGKPAHDWDADEWNSACDRDGKSLMHYCALSGQSDVAEYLINAMPGLNLVDTRNSSSQTALHVAAASGSFDLCTLLARNGGNVLSRDNAGFTPLHVAARWGNVDAVQALLNHGAKHDAETKSGQTVLDIARAYNHANLLKIILAPPHPPSRPVALWKARHGLLVVHWELQPAMARGTTVDLYHLQMKKSDNDSDSWCDLPRRSFTRSNFCAVDLRSSDVASYKFRVRARNGADQWSEWSDTSHSVSTLETEVRFVLPKQKLRVLEDFTLSLRVEGSKPSETSWIGLYHAHTPVDCAATSRRYYVSEVARAPNGTFVWEGRKGFPTDGVYEFRLYDGANDSDATPLGRSARIDVRTDNDMHRPERFMRDAYRMSSRDGVPFICADGAKVRCSPWLLACRSKVLFHKLYVSPRGVPSNYIVL